MRSLLGAKGSWWLDAKLGIRMLIKSPGLALVGGVGIAVAVAIAVGAFSVIYGTYLASSIPLEQGDRLVSLEIWDSAANAPEPRIGYDFQRWRAELKSVEQLSAFRTLRPNLIARGAQPESVRVAAMSASGFRVARVQPLLGRHLADEDEREGAPRVVVIGESVWRNRFAASPAILGRHLQLGAATYSIVGVMPESFAFPVNHRFWVPLRESSTPPMPLTGPDLMVFGRLAPGTTLAAAQAELSTVAQRTAQAFPKLYERLRPQAMAYSRPFLGLHGTQDANGLHVMQGIVQLLLVLVCLNVAILVYTRTAMRQSEIALRTALGASRGRIVVQLFIEALVLSGVAALAGVAIAALALRYVESAVVPLAPELPFWLSFQLVPSAVFYAGLLSVLAAAIVGILPALKATQRNVQTGFASLGSGGSGMKMGRTWTILIVAQVGFAVGFLPEALYSAWSTLRAGIADPGFAAREFLSVELGLDPESTDGAGTGEFMRHFGARQAELMRRLESEPRVTAVTFAMANPGEEAGASLEVEGGGSGYAVRYNRVDLGYFKTFDVPILAGRGFAAGDLFPSNAFDSENRIVVVNQALAQRIFGGQALGRRIRYTGQPTGPWHEIVGVVRDFPPGLIGGMDESPLKLYHPIGLAQVQPARLTIRLRGDTPVGYSGRLRELAASVDPELLLRNILGLDEALRRDQWIRRLEAAVLAAVTLTVLMLSAAGIYALMSFTVSQRRREIGIRVALGAGAKSILIRVFSRALAQLAAGATLGIASAILIERAWGNMQGSELVVLPLVAVIMMAVGALATLGPAIRSLRLEPTEALREQ